MCKICMLHIQSDMQSEEGLQQDCSFFWFIIIIIIIIIINALFRKMVQIMSPTGDFQWFHSYVNKINQSINQEHNTSK